MTIYEGPRAVYHGSLLPLCCSANHEYFVKDNNISLQYQD